MAVIVHALQWCWSLLRINCGVKLSLAVTLLCTLLACTYTKYLGVHAMYHLSSKNNPSLNSERYTMGTINYYVYGVAPQPGYLSRQQLVSVLAFANKYQQWELVDSAHNIQVGSHFALAMPEGSYTLVVGVDMNENHRLTADEFVTSMDLVLSKETAPGFVHGLKRFPQAKAANTQAFGTGDSINIAVPEVSALADSLFYPTGTIRSLDDPIFDAKMATVGLYDPASFIDKSPIMFYALEDYLDHKIPVVFVHGINGSAREFTGLIEGLDSRKFKFWFFHYPSGGDLDQLGELFYDIFISGTVIPSSEMPMAIVAHSMGGLIVRRAFNHVRGHSAENIVSLYLTLATPFGGHAKAATGERRAPLVIPAWRDLNPNNNFIQTLFEKPLPSTVEHHLLYAYGNTNLIRFGENSDGVVSLSSQLHFPAQQQAIEQFGVNATHSGILYDSVAQNYIVDQLNGLTNIYPPEQLALFEQGGFDTSDMQGYSEMARYNIENYGKFIVALSQGLVKPMTPVQENFLQAIAGEKDSQTSLEEELVRFVNSVKHQAQ